MAQGSIFFLWCTESLQRLFSYQDQTWKGDLGANEPKSLKTFTGCLNVTLNWKALGGGEGDCFTLAFGDGTRGNDIRIQLPGNLWSFGYFRDSHTEWACVSSHVSTLEMGKQSHPKSPTYFSNAIRALLHTCPCGVICMIAFHYSHIHASCKALL